MRSQSDSLGFLAGALFLLFLLSLSLSQNLIAFVLYFGGEKTTGKVQEVVKSYEPHYDEDNDLVGYFSIITVIGHPGEHYSLEDVHSGYEVPILLSEKIHKLAVMPKGKNSLVTVCKSVDPYSGDIRVIILSIILLAGLLLFKLIGLLAGVMVISDLIERCHILKSTTSWRRIIWAFSILFYWGLSGLYSLYLINLYLTFAVTPVLLFTLITVAASILFILPELAILSFFSNSNEQGQGNNINNEARITEQ